MLVEEHSPTSLPEYVRMRGLPSGARLKFVYDCPDFEEFDIFCRDARGLAQLDADALHQADELTLTLTLTLALALALTQTLTLALTPSQADEHNVMLKNPRDDRFTLVIIPR